MSAPSTGSSKKIGRPRGRRAAPQVPCDACIARAAAKKEEGGSLELCDNCTANLRRPRKKQQEPSYMKRIRRQSNAIIDTALGVRTDPVGVPWSDNSQEQHSVQFFIKHSSPQLAGYFDSPFWQRTVLQAGRHEPSVRHAIAAIGALHEKLLTGAINPDHAQDERTQFALEQCNKSIQHLVKPHVCDLQQAERSLKGVKLSNGSSKTGVYRSNTCNATDICLFQGSKTKPDLQLMLTTCVLFTCFEALQGHCDQAIIHATQGYALLQQFAIDPDNTRWDVGAFAVELDQLCLLMRRLQTQGDSVGKIINTLPDPEVLNATRPTVFNSIQEARVGLELVLNQLTVFFLDMELDDEFYNMAVTNVEKHFLFSPWLTDWEKAFSVYLSQHQAVLDDEDRTAAMVLKAHHLVAEIFAGVDLALKELGWDAFHDKFTAIVDLAGVILASSKETDNSTIEARWKADGSSISGPTATLSFSLGIVDPLYEVCARCRDPILRRRALDLLAKHPRQECVWSSWSAWKVGRFLMRLEENKLEQQHKQQPETLLRRHIAEAWPHCAELSGELPQRGKHQKAIPRATARYSLNPGLFENWSVLETGLDSYAQTPFTIPDLSVSDFTTVQSNLGHEFSAALGAAIPEDFIAPTWIDFEGLQQSLEDHSSTPPGEWT